MSFQKAPYNIVDAVTWRRRRRRRTMSHLKLNSFIDVINFLINAVLHLFSFLWSKSIKKTNFRDVIHAVKAMLEMGCW